MAKKEIREVSILTVLNEINTPIVGTKVRTFSLMWIRKSGDQRGVEKLVEKCQKSRKDQRLKYPHAKKKIRNTFNLKKFKTLLLWDVVEDHPLHVAIETIIEYNGYRVNHRT